MHVSLVIIDSQTAYMYLNIGTCTNKYTTVIKGKCRNS